MYRLLANAWHGRQFSKHFPAKNPAHKKIYGLTSENDVAHPAGDLRMPNERNIQFSQCGWARGHFLGSSGDELADTPGGRQAILSEPEGESGHGRSPNETSEEGVDEVRDDSIRSSPSFSSLSDCEIQERTNLSVSADMTTDNSGWGCAGVPSPSFM